MLLIERPQLALQQVWESDLLVSDWQASYSSSGSRDILAAELQF